MARRKGTTRIAVTAGTSRSLLAFEREAHVAEGRAVVCVNQVHFELDARLAVRNSLEIDKSGDSASSLENAGREGLCQHVLCRQLLGIIGHQAIIVERIVSERVRPGGPARVVPGKMRLSEEQSENHARLHRGGRLRRLAPAGLAGGPLLI